MSNRVHHHLDNRAKKYRSTDRNMVRIRTERHATSKKIIVAAIVLLFQLLIILSLNVLYIGFRWYIYLNLCIAIITAISVLSSNKHGQSKAVWVLFILVCFPIGFIIYFLSNEKIMFGASKRRYKKIFERTENYMGEFKNPEGKNVFTSTCRYLHNAGGFVPYKDNKMQYFPSAASMFDDAIENMKKAEHFIFIEYFNVANGVLFGRIWDVLKEKLAQGVKVRIVYDDMGSRALPRKVRKMIRSAGAELKTFNRLISFFTFALNYRDHHKIISIDGKIAYTGGCNLADEYVNERRMYGYWKDAGLRIEGPAVDALTLTFLRQWEFITKKQEDYSQYFNHFELHENDACVVPFAGGPEYDLPICKSVYESLITGAKRRLYIMTPYFIPDDTINSLLKNKALSGVDVRIILPEIPDKYYVYLLTKDNAEDLISCGVKVYYMKDSFVHSKVVLSDECAMIGSINLDLRSFFQQFENAVCTDDKSVLADVEKDFENTFDDSILVEQRTQNPFFRSMAIAVLRLLSPLM